jgi:fibronectin type 3 domain-containing protein
LATICSSTACTYTDTSVQAGQSYWYYAAAVDTGGNVSVPSNIVSAVTP